MIPQDLFPHPCDPPSPEALEVARLRERLAESTQMTAESEAVRKAAFRSIESLVRCIPREKHGDVTVAIKRLFETIEAIQGDVMDLSLEHNGGQTR